jgi:hypothetical protein
MNTLNKERKDHEQKKTWSADDEQEYDQAIQEIKQENKSLLAEKKLMMRRTRKVRLFPAKAQRKLSSRTWARVAGLTTSGCAPSENEQVES